MRLPLPGLMLLLANLGLAAGLAAQESGQTAAPAESRAKLALEEANSLAGSLELLGGEDGMTTLALLEKPIMRFTNPLLGELYAHVFIWHRAGRPEAVASINRWFAPVDRTGLEIQSLSRGPLVATRGGKKFWHPAKAGVSFQAVSGAQEPAKSTVGRRRQMRSMVRDFSVFARGTERLVNVAENLRLMDRPIYRYQSSDPSILDGAIFAFVRGTDPELLLLVEAQRRADEYRWRFAFARLNSLQFRASYQGREVWDAPQIAPPWSNLNDPSQSYLLLPSVDAKEEHEQR